MNKTRLERIRDYSTASFGSRAGSAIAAALWPGYQIGRFLKLSAVNSQLRYEIRVAPFMAANMPWMFWPAYRLLRASNICFVLNSSDGTGHIIPELDNFFRMLFLGELDPSKRYVWVRKSNDFTRTCVRFYRHKFWWAIANNLVYDLLLLITVRYRDITLDVGIARSKWQLSPSNEYHPPDDRQTFLHFVSKAEATRQTLDWYTRRLKSAEYFPLADATFENGELIQFLKGNTDRLALVHIKTYVANATAAPTDPETYLEALSYLTDLGYNLVFVGREEMPDVFHRYGIINYSESRIASFSNDIQLFNMAQAAIVGASGIGWLAEVFKDIPYLFLNSWHIGRPLFGRNCIYVPTLVTDPSGSQLSFSDQIELYHSLPDLEHEFFPASRFRARNATSDEILAATQEMIALKNEHRERSALQEGYRRIDEGNLMYLSLARCSEYFLQKHSALLRQPVAR
jgi:putative glycosyltransferase (TIGR04372 family)